MNRQPGFQDHYSEGYDIAQEAIAFLCEHIGERLGDPCVTRLGKIITVERACFRYVDRYLDKQYIRHYNRSVSLDDKLPAEPIIPFDTTEDDAAAVDALIEKMHLKPKELDTLNAYMSGMKFMELTRLMNVDHTTIFNDIKGIYDIRKHTSKKQWESISSRCFLLAVQVSVFEEYKGRYRSVMQSSFC